MTLTGGVYHTGRGTTASDLYVRCTYTCGYTPCMRLVQNGLEAARQSRGVRTKRERQGRRKALQSFPQRYLSTPGMSTNESRSGWQGIKKEPRENEEEGQFKRCSPRRKTRPEDLRRIASCFDRLRDKFITIFSSRVLRFLGSFMGLHIQKKRSRPEASRK